MSSFIESLEQRQFFAAGTLDTTFATNGTAAVEFKPIKNDFAIPQQMLVDSGGRTYVATTTNTTLQIVRRTREGAADTTFAGGAGRIERTGLQFFFNPTKVAKGTIRVTLDSKDRLYVLVGNGLYRYTAAGVLDTSFARDGFTKLTGLFDADDLVVDRESRIWIAGTQIRPIVGPSSAEYTLGFSVARLTEAGVYDASFAENGLFNESAIGPENSRRSAQGHRIRLLADGSVVAAANITFEEPSTGLYATGVQVLKFTSAGRLNQDYGRRGRAYYLTRHGDTTFGEANVTAIRPDGAVVVDEAFATEDPENVGGDKFNRLIDNRGVALPQRVNVDSPGDDNYVERAEYFAGADGTQYVINTESNTLYRMTADGQYDTTFNGGAPLRDISVAALTGDGTLLTLSDYSPATGFSFELQRRYTNESPVGVLYGKSLRTPATSIRFSVIYRDDDGVDAASITGQELRIVSPTGVVARPRLVSVTKLADGTYQAVYKFANPANGGGSFTRADNGVYGLRVLAGTIKDTGGAAVAKRILGTIRVAIA